MTDNLDEGPANVYIYFFFRNHGACGIFSYGGSYAKQSVEPVKTIWFDNKKLFSHLFHKLNFYTKIHFYEKNKTVLMD